MVITHLRTYSSLSITFLAGRFIKWLSWTELNPSQETTEIRRLVP